jgi:hypothetical protein
MRVMVVHHTPSLTRDRYEAVVRGLTDGKPRLESPDDLPTEGLLVHVAAESDRGFMIFDVFEFEEAFTRFREVASSIATAAGIESRPRASRSTPTSPSGELSDHRRQRSLRPSATRSQTSTSLSRGGMSRWTTNRSAARFAGLARVQAHDWRA